MVFNDRSAMREVVAGIYDYVGRHTKWEVAHIEAGPRALFDLSSLAWLNGFIAAGYPDYATLSSAGPKTWKRVFFSCRPELGTNIVTADETEYARLAIDEFVNMGLKRVGFFSIAPTPRGQAFKAEAKRRGIEYHEFVRTVSNEEYWPRRHEYAGQWLLSLPKPIGVLAHVAEFGQTLTAAATLEGIHVPEQVAILACEAPADACELSRPTLSSVTGGQREIGFESARMLDRLFHGKPAGGPVLIPPTKVERRGSTDLLAIADPDLAKAIRLLRNSATEEHSITEVLKLVPLTRNQLEHGTRKVLNRSPYEEIMRIRMETACKLLRETSLTIAEVAVHSGLGTVSNFCKVFKRRFGDTPRHYRLSKDISR